MFIEQIHKAAGRKTEIIFRLDFTVTDKIVVEVMQKHKLIVAFTTSNNAVWMRISVNCYK